MRKMRISIFSGLALIASLSAAQIRAVPHYDPSTETSLTGTVQEVTQQVRGRMGRIHVSLATDAGVFEVRLGPKQFLDSKNFGVAKGDHLDLVGSRMEVDGTTFFVAREVTKRDRKSTRLNSSHT